MFEKFKSSKAYRIMNGVATSAILALLLSLVFFGYDVYRDSDQDRRDAAHFDQTVQRLDEVRQSLSTRCLGTFPIYLRDINHVLERLQPLDTVIVFEDVLYYGIKSRPADFRRFNQLLFDHAHNGGKIIVAYYDNHGEQVDVPWNSIFHRVILESRVAIQYVPMVKSEHRECIMKKAQQSDHENMRDYAIQLDKDLTEKYFRLTCNQNRKAAEIDIKGYLDSALVVPLQMETAGDTLVDLMCRELQVIKRQYLEGKTVEDVSFGDYKQMYSDMTDCIARYYSSLGFELIPMNEYLTMSCWLCKPSNPARSTEAILAFPSKYASDEIGFYSQDAAFSRYITMILNGVRNNIDTETKLRSKNKE